MLKFRVDLPDSKKQVIEKPIEEPPTENGQKKISSGYEEIVLNDDPIELDTIDHTSNETSTESHCEPVVLTNTLDVNKSETGNVEIQLAAKQVGGILLAAEQVGGSESLDVIMENIDTAELKLHQALVGPQQNASTARCTWSIPDTDSDDDFLKQKQSWAAGKTAKNLPSITMEHKRPIQNFNLPSDSEEEEEEDPYSTAKSPSLSIKSAEPPLPPPVSTIPRTYKAMPASPLEENLPSEKPPSDSRRRLQVNAMVDIRKRSITSASDTDPYDEIEYNSEKPMDSKEGQSQPRYKFTLSKARTRLNPSDITYAEIPKKIQWNFPSSSDEEEEMEQKRHKKVNTSKQKFTRQHSSSSEEGDKPSVPPKMWEDPSNFDVKGQQDTTNDFVEHSEHSRGSEDFGVRDTKSQNTNDHDITIEYSAFRRSGVSRTGSLLGPDDNEDQGSPTGTNSSGFDENNDIIEELSEHSENSCKAMTDYEQSSTCVDMDQLSLDSSGKRPKRIVETHETHEIVPADNNEDDIVERIIETQTITEKLDDNRKFNDYSGEDYSKYLDNDDEFVSHIFTLGRTLEKGSKKKKPKDFAFVENPFSVPEPVIETMPLEKKTVKQKITTLVKKKKTRDDENIYAEVKPSVADEDSFRECDNFDDDTDDYNHTNDTHQQGASVWDAVEGGAISNSESSRGNRASNISNDNSLVYETLNDPPTASFSKPMTTTDKKKEPKKSIFKGIKKLLKKKDKAHDTDKRHSLVLEDDYQEFVP